MVRLEGRFEVRLIDRKTLATYMKFRGHTVRSLAAEVRCSHQVIGHLRSGARSTCKPETAVEIEKALNCPPGSLFVPRISHVAREVRSKRIAA